MTTEQELPHTPEQVVDVGRGISLCYETFGDPSREPLLLISGLGQQMHAWPTDLCRELAARGLHVIRFDNRDVGRSTHVRVKPPSPLQLATRRFSDRQYALGAMALDASGLLDALGLDSAHVAGRSMGGMIAQVLTARQPARVRSLTSIMSMTGARKAGRPALSTWRLMAAPPAKTREKSIENAVVLWRHIGSHGFPFDEAQVRADAGLAFDRGHNPAGVARQLAAIMKSGDRTREVATITAPTLVIHGDRDMMVHPTGGVATANAIPGARHETIVGMGHDLPVGAWPRLVELISGHVAAASGAPADAAAAA